ncbi:MAG: hypothetical protein UW88_C0006G0008 [Candidatus Collierbacteria bacterium GW2011_GWD2_45_10]|uniref:AB hydrolase-1 domain-containing protein n=1 Tax=Candidatus Collierbacteria bacterium GW2011_GWB2_44_22 TaxID=1618387 RepID=A0A0G1HZ86_9BACT|nr:MAG: hypothetical protein UW31_C0007G0049 [Candidatus Collierbacteria bacterium GW2011_GWA2_44_13]KKT49431.1 MAG: hypothetical protein UW42_C0035G0015 [Candidatus Collierbacteria bacterium GW2011_GWB1_44_197]KKT52280.1 MAG: hypothetical protein UW44_C0003G0123 [Candidatus Collierbacteria bacterium GW2011_GWB2_44_22]KKT63200.1 MAG: hypothetical protein UW56_C0001G0037 [Candidatus Collierbacteria bacterium GW2011_GWD1_44_27]KKT66110.1 MAG: hypothetical protein UW58_C0013G0038 [Candidatus Colli
MIHGWGTRSYNSNLDCEKVVEGTAWSQRQELVNLLEKRYPVRFFNLPGFCCVKEPKKESFDLEDFSDYLGNWVKEQNVKPEAIVGYSFGGAVALDYKVRHKSNIPVILISPALKRKETVKSQMGKIGKHIVPERYFDSLKSLYQSIFSRYYREGTPFLRASYDKIARRDIRPLLELVDPKDILLVYGDSDTSTPADYISEIVEKNGLNCLIIKGGDHNIGETHPDEVSSAIINFLSK